MIRKIVFIKIIFAIKLFFSNLNLINIFNFINK